MITLLALLGPPALAENVVGGDPVPDGERLDVAAVYFGNQVGCTGVLIAPDVALTAGHCADGITSIEIATNDYTEVGESLRVVEIIEYPNSQSTYDIAVLLLETESDVAPANIAMDCVLDAYLEDGAEVAIVGYGATDIYGNQYGTELMEGHTWITDHDCTDLGSGCNQSVSPGGEIGAGGDLDGESIDACYGDSGGPLYVVTDKGDFLVGLTSRAYSGVYPPCAHGGIYVRPDAVVDWIEEVSGRLIPRPDCAGDWSYDINERPVPTADPIEVPKGGSAETTVVPNDPDPDDTHTFAVISAPNYGQATPGADGVVTYTSAGTYLGSDRFEVEVTDDRGRAGAVWVDVDIVEAPEDTGGSDTGGADPTGGGGSGETGGDPEDPGDPGAGAQSGGQEAASEGCGCATSGGGALPSLGLLLLGILRRRRPGDSSTA